MRKSYDWGIKSYAWVGPQQLTQNGLELRAVVAEDQRGNYHSGTRYGPRGIALPELGWEEYWKTDAYKTKDCAIFAAKIDATETLRGCNEHARTEALLNAATTSNPEPKKRSRPHLRLIDR